MADVDIKAFAGLRNDINQERMEPGDLVAAVNVDIGNDGQLSRRLGIESKLSADAHSLWANDDICLFVESSVLKRLHNDYTTTTVRTLTSNDRVAYCAVNGRIYFSNDTDTGVIEQNGQSRTWGMVPPTVLSMADTGGSLSSGTYQALMTYLREDGQESGAGEAGSVNVSTGGILFSGLPVSDDPGVVAKAIYITAQNGDVFYLAKILNADVTTYTYGGGSQALPLNTQYLQQAPAGEIVAYHYGVLYVVKGSVVYPSTAFGYELFDLQDFIAFDSPVRIFAPVENGIWVGTDKEVAWLGGVTPDKFEKAVRAEIGSVKGTLAYVSSESLPEIKENIQDAQVALWWTDEGVYAGYPSGTLHKLTESRYHPSIDGQSGAGFVLEQTGGDKYLAVINH
jgi:hypothetical protein